MHFKGVLHKNIGCYKSKVYFPNGIYEVTDKQKESVHTISRRSDDMNKKLIQDTAQKHGPKKHKLRNGFFAFVSGGTLAAVMQLYMMGCMYLFDLDKETAVSISVVSVILLTTLLTGLGIYDKIAQFCGAGLFIPISGFANSLTSCAMEGRFEGPIYGIGSNMFKLAGSVLTYGVVSAFVFGTLRYLFFGG